MILTRYLSVHYFVRDGSLHEVGAESVWRGAVATGVVCAGS